MKSEGGLINKIKQNKWFDKIAKIKNIEIIIAIIVCVIVITIYFIINAAANNNAKTATDNAVAQITVTDNYSEAEIKLSEILSKIKNAGEVHVLITDKSVTNLNDTETVSTQTASAIVGVLVVAKGAGDVVVKLELIRAVQTATGISADKIEVFEMK